MRIYFGQKNKHQILFLDSRDGNGFWMPFKVYAVWGQFCCPEVSSCCWESKEIQVDVLVRQFYFYIINMNTYFFLQYRYNFENNTGEVKIDREYRQRCPKHGGRFVSPLVGDLGGAKWVMMKAQRSIMKKYYGDGLGQTISLLNNNQRSRNSTGSSGDSWDSTPSPSSSTSYRQGTSWNNSISSNSRQGSSWDMRARQGGPERRDERKMLPLYKPLPSHSREDCEACLLRRCPYPR